MLLEKSQKKKSFNKKIKKYSIITLIIILLLSVVVFSLNYIGHDFTQSSCGEVINSNYEWDECFIGSVVCFNILSLEGESDSLARQKHDTMKQALTNFAINKGCNQIRYEISQLPENDKWKIKVNGFLLDKTFYVNDDGEII